MKAARAIQAIACEQFGIEMADLVGPIRTRTFAMARHLAMYLCRERLSLSYPEIAIVFGRTNHTTVLYACERVKEQVALDPFMKSHLYEMNQAVEEVSLRREKRACQKRRGAA